MGAGDQCSAESAVNHHEADAEMTSRSKVEEELSCL